jgi:hypothetical protein
MDARSGKEVPVAGLADAAAALTDAALGPSSTTPLREALATATFEEAL